MLKDTIEEEKYTYEGLIQNKKYNIKIVAVAKNEKTAEVLVDRETGKITDLTTANTTFSYNPEGWTNGSVTATASTTVTGYTLQTSKDGKTWTSTASQTFTANGTIYARLYDGKNYGGTASGNVTNIDKTKPTISTALTGTASSTIATQATLSTTVNDTNSGLSKIVWQWGTSTSYGSSATSTYTEMYGTTTGTTGNVAKTYLLTGLTAGTTYYAKITVYDVAGNSETSTATFKTGTAVAQVGSVLYTSIQNAVNVISTSGTVTVLVNTTESPTIPSEKTITLALNSKTVTGTITNSGTINISGGTINSGSNSGRTLVNYGTTTLSSGTLSTNEGWTVYNTGTFTMTGGTVKVTNTGNHSAVVNAGTMNMSGGTITSTAYGLVTRGSNAVSTVTGGTIKTTATSEAAVLADNGGRANITNTIVSSANVIAMTMPGSGTSGLEIKLIRCTITGKTMRPASDSRGILEINVTTSPAGFGIYWYTAESCSTVQFPTWTANNGQDDLKWYNASSTTIYNSTCWYYNVYTSNHNNETGSYNVHVYKTVNGTQSSVISSGVTV